MDNFGKALSLVARQRIHGVDNNGLDARPGMALAVVQNGIQKTLGLARAGACRYQSIGCTTIRRQPLPGQLLMRIRWKRGVKASKEIDTCLALQKRQAQRHIRPLQKSLAVLLLLHQTAKLPLNRLRFGFKTGNDELAQSSGHLSSQQARDHALSFYYFCRRQTISALTLA